MLHTIWLWLLVPFSLYCISTYLKPVEGARDVRVLLGGILGLAYAAFGLHATYSLFAWLPHSAILFRIAHGIVGGMMVAMLLSMGYRHGVRVLLIFAVILLLASPLLVALILHRVGRAVALHSILTSPHFYSLESWPVGIAVPAIVMLLRPSSNGNKGTGDNSGLASESGTED
ncbi:MAG TPA: hypothetical protein VHD85_19730 [Terracidiphilus sp.]|nr:hypothetical protein [Terracidiphilus sp.]